MSKGNGYNLSTKSQIDKEVRTDRMILGGLSLLFYLAGVYGVLRKRKRSEKGSASGSSDRMAGFDA